MGENEISVKSNLNAGPGIGGSEIAMADRIDAIIANAAARSPFPGLSVLIERKENVIYRKGFGLAEVENGVKTTPDHVFCIGSISKSMTSFCLMQLVDQGKISLDDKASLHVDRLPPGSDLMTVGQLLNHTSGLFNYTNVLDGDEYSQKAYSRAELKELIIGAPLDFPPGHAWNYCNSGLYLAGLIIENISGSTLEDYMQTHIFEPFGMSNSSTAGWRKTVSHRAFGYRSGVGSPGLENAPRFDPSAALGAGGVMTTVDDLLKYRKALFGESSVIPASIQERLLARGDLADGTPLPYTFGCLVDNAFEGHQKLAHSGTITGFSAQFAYYPDDDVTIILLTNNDQGVVAPVSLERKIARVVLGLPEPTTLDLPLDNISAQPFIGDFSLVNFFFGFNRLGYAVDDGRLKVRVGGIDAEGPFLPLMWQGGGEFVSALDDEQKFSFTPSGDALTFNFYGGELRARRASLQS